MPKYSFCGFQRVSDSFSSSTNEFLAVHLAAKRRLDIETPKSVEIHTDSLTVAQSFSGVCRVRDGDAPFESTTKICRDLLGSGTTVKIMHVHLQSSLSGNKIARKLARRGRLLYSSGLTSEESQGEHFKDYIEFLEANYMIESPKSEAERQRGNPHL